MSLESLEEDLLEQLLDLECTGNVDAEVELPPLLTAAPLQRRVVDKLYKKDSRNHGTAIHVACFNGNVAIATALLRGGADANIRGPDGQTSLHVAAQKGHLDIVEVLLKGGADINAADKQGLTALHVSILENEVEIALYLVTKGSNLNRQDCKGNLPLHHAIRSGNGALIKTLIEAGSEKETFNKRHDSPLHIATRLGHIPTIKLLLKLGCDVNICKPDGTTPLHILVTNCVKTPQFKIILELFLLAGCNINSQAHSTLETPLYNTIISEKEHFAMILLSYGANPNISSPFGITALQFSFNNQFYQVVIMLLHCGIEWKREQWLQYYPISNSMDPSALLKVIHSWKSSPVKLIDLCRIAIRNHYQEKLFYAVDKLLLVPKPVKDFLLLKDLLPADDICLTASVGGASGMDKLKWAELESEDISEAPETRKNEDEDICV